MRCREFLLQALAADPGFGKAQAALAESAVLNSLLYNEPPGQAAAAALQAAARAFECRSGRSGAHVARGLITAIFDFNFAGAEAEFLRALEINPKSISARNWYGAACLAPLGRLDEAITQLRLAQEQKPLCMLITHHLAYILSSHGQADAAVEELNRSFQVEPDCPLTHWSLGIAQIARGNDIQAVEAFERAVQLSESAPYAESALAYAYSKIGDLAKAEAIRENFVRRNNQARTADFELAVIYSGMGRKNEAVDALGRARAQRHPWLHRLGIDIRTSSIAPLSSFF